MASLRAPRGWRKQSDGRLPLVRVPGLPDDLAHDQRRRHLVDTGPDAQLNTYFQGNQIAVGPDGTLYNVTANLFTGAVATAPTVYMGVMRSQDAGRTWSAPTKISTIRTAQLFVPDDNFPIRAEDYLPDIAVDPTNGDIYVVWSDGSARPSTRS